MAWFALFAAGIALTLTSCSKHPANSPTTGKRDEAIPVNVALVEVVPLNRTLPVFGTLLPMNEAVLSAQVEGQVENTRADFGEHVERGQELALIDTASYEALGRQAAANVAKAKANALNAEQNLARVAELIRNHIGSASELDAATAQAEQARADVKATEASDAFAQLNLRRSRVQAPFAGSISERVASAGDFVRVGSALFRLVDDSELKFLVQAPERYAGLVKPAQAVRFSVDAWPEETFEGTVYLISPSVIASTRSFNVAARVPNQNGKLKANTFARGELLLQSDVPTPVVPLEAVISFAGVTKVFVVEENLAKSRTITTGRVKEGRQEVTEGLKVGERVVTTGQTKLFEGAKVRVQDGGLKTVGTGAKTASS